jgi:hypothetical protein
LRGWIALIGGVSLAVVLSLIASTGHFGETPMWIGKSVLTILLVGVLLFSAFFGYISFRAKALKWGVYMSIIAVLSVIGSYILVEKVIFLILLTLALIGGCFFGYISFKEKSRKLGVGSFAILFICIALLYLIISGW